MATMTTTETEAVFIGVFNAHTTLICIWPRHRGGYSTYILRHVKAGQIRSGKLMMSRRQRVLSVFDSGTTKLFKVRIQKAPLLGVRLSKRANGQGKNRIAGTTRYEDFQSSCRSGTMCHHRSLLVSIQAFNGGLRPSILPIRTHSDI